MKWQENARHTQWNLLKKIINVKKEPLLKVR